MAAISTLLAGAAIAAGVAGTAVSYMGQQKAAEGAEKAEGVRRRQMELQAQRERRQVIREAAIARSSAVSSAEAQGAQTGSGIQGGIGQIASNQAFNIGAINQNEGLGRAMFSANRQISSGQTMASIGSSIQNFGSVLTNNFDRLNRLGTFAGAQ